jgi:hypothetical protein
MHISFSWWNIGHKPPVAGVAKTKLHGLMRPWFFNCYLDDLIGLDFISFGEVDSDFAQTMEKPFWHNGYDLVDASGKDGRLIFDICIFYRRAKLELLSYVNIAVPHYSGRLKVATRFDFIIKETGDSIYFYVSHWPSQLSRPDIGRDELGVALRQDIQSLFDAEGHHAKIILMGDYNNEPFDKPIYDKLGATRDKDILIKNPFLLYNPFWRNLGASSHYARSRKTSPCHGTYFYKSSSHVTKWFTFDQIIVSSAFLGSSSWHLIEEATKVYHYDEESMFGKDFFHGYDHLPIFGRVERH